jgi:ubiquinone/menaquinone biosynthesis C-methylase UbiE
MNIFFQATQSGWYPQFLEPVVEEITNDSNNKTVLDIGTGPGTLPQMLIKQNQSFQITGIDISDKMIAEAKRRTKHKNITFLNQQPTDKTSFKSNTFDVVTFCSVLFLLDDSTKKSLMNEAIRLLKPNGKIIVFTPSGNKPVILSFVEVWKYPFSMNNYTFIVWKTATTHSGRKWKQQKWLARFADENKLNYSSSLTFNNNALMEIITKK